MRQYFFEILLEVDMWIWNLKERTFLCSLKLKCNDGACYLVYSFDRLQKICMVAEALPGCKVNLKKLERSLDTLIFEVIHAKPHWISWLQYVGILNDLKQSWTWKQCHVTMMVFVLKFSVEIELSAFLIAIAHPTTFTQRAYVRWSGPIQTIVSDHILIYPAQIQMSLTIWYSGIESGPTITRGSYKDHGYLANGLLCFLLRGTVYRRTSHWLYVIFG